MSSMKIGRHLTWTFTLPVPKDGINSKTFSVGDWKLFLRFGEEIFDDGEKAYYLRICSEEEYANSSCTCFVIFSNSKCSQMYEGKLSFSDSNRENVFKIAASRKDDLLGKVDDSFPKYEGTFMLIFDQNYTLKLNTESDNPPVYSTDNFCLESLSKDLSKLFEQRLRTDIELACGDQTIPAHSNILSCRSEVFSKMLGRDWSETRTGRVEIRDIDTGIFEDFVRYMYTGKLPELTVDTAKHLYEIADRYQMVCLARRCANLLLEKIRPEEASEVLLLADAHNDSDFKEKVVNYILLMKIPLREDIWLPFTEDHTNLANEILYRFYKLQQKQAI